MYKTRFTPALAIFTAAATASVLAGCSTFRNALALDSGQANLAPIHNPFAGLYDPATAQKENRNITLRTKKGDRSIELELPGATADMSEFVMPMSPSFRDSARSTNGGRAPASTSSYDDGGDESSYKERQPSITDREITNRFPQGRREDDSDRREVETGLGVMPSEDSAPAADRSYLASLDQVKKFYKSARYEAALLEIDEMMRAYPTDPKLYEMRGTLLDRVGRTDLALKSWSQALRLDPSNPSLKRFVDRKQSTVRAPAGVPPEVPPAPATEVPKP